jgi:hypothetical protein
MSGTSSWQHMMTVLGGQTNVNAIFLDILQDIVENAYTTAEYNIIGKGEFTWGLLVGYTNIILWEFRDYLLGDERHHRN